ncbi:unnamed protein product [Lasius platythorax]|uniref:Uncharacterized protein n=1 Tax=Lasius platythorax TaxID=488582 RepID=A0AAV2MVS6_9HYME
MQLQSFAGPFDEKLDESVAEKVSSDYNESVVTHHIERGVVVVYVVFAMLYHDVLLSGYKTMDNGDGKLSSAT